MILEDDVVTEDGSLTVISRGTTLTVTLIERIQSFARTRGVRDPIQVRVPQGSLCGRVAARVGAITEMALRSTARAKSSRARATSLPETATLWQWMTSRPT
jgi:hypothetical protein